MTFRCKDIGIRKVCDKDSIPLFENPRKKRPSTFSNIKNTFKG